MSRFKDYLKNKRHAGLHDSLIAPELVLSDEQLDERQDYNHNLQKVSPEQAELIRELVGSDESIVTMNEQDYVNPVDLSPEVEAIINRENNDKYIPNNGPFYAENDKLTVHARNLEKECELLKETLKATIQKNRMLVAERNSNLRAMEEIALKQGARIRQAQVKKLATLMQTKGLLDNTQEAFSAKIKELSSLSNQAFSAVKQTVLTAPERRVEANNFESKLKQFASGSALNTQIIHTPHLNDTNDVATRLQKLPWNSTTH